MSKTTRRLSMLATIVWMAAGAAWIVLSVVIKITTSSNTAMWVVLAVGVVIFLVANRGWAKLEYTPEKP